MTLNVTFILAQHYGVKIKVRVSKNGDFVGAVYNVRIYVMCCGLPYLNVSCISDLSDYYFR